MVGVNSVVSRAIGTGDMDRAARHANVGVVFALALGALMGLALWLLTDPLFRLLQAPANLMPLIERYMGPFALGMPLLLLQMGLNGVLRAQGEAKRTSAVAVTYAAANWVLDPLLITGGFGLPALGIAGAAWATTIGYLLAVVLAAWLVHGAHLPLDLALVRQARLGPALRDIVGVAAPASFSNAINPIGLSVLTALLASQGQEAVAGFGAAGRLQSFATVPLLALSASIGAIVGQNWGAGQRDRARRAFLEASGFCVAYGMALAIVLFAAGDWFATFFTEDPKVMREFARYMQIAAWGYAGFGLLIVANGALNAIGRANWSLGQSFARVFLVMLPVAWFLRPDWGSPAIYTAELAANAVGGGLAAFIAWRMLSRR